ncbi:MAG: holo-ACP synthase [Candidatus Competibacteraceae bacterium]|jgi:holo-[acyl-carrier protein] synthase|nr:holo-ACP synthase [Candidatus Competibacteraceae bacterium]
MASDIYGIGTDIVEIARIHDILKRFGERFAQRILTEDELADYRNSAHPERFLARRFAAKEAVVKALGLGFRAGLTMNAIGVAHDDYGKPEIVFREQAARYVDDLGITARFISISDEREYALAFVVLAGRCYPER